MFQRICYLYQILYTTTYLCRKITYIITRIVSISNSSLIQSYFLAQTCSTAMRGPEKSLTSYRSIIVGTFLIWFESAALSRIPPGQQNPTSVASRCLKTNTKDRYKEHRVTAGKISLINHETRYEWRTSDPQLYFFNALQRKQQRLCSKTRI